MRSSLIAVAGVGAQLACLDYPPAPAPVDAVVGGDEGAGAPATCSPYGAHDPANRCRVCGPDGVFVPCPFSCDTGGRCARALEVTGGEQHACALLDDGAVWCWGQQRFGAVGAGVLAERVQGPSPVLQAVAMAEVRAGLYHTCARDQGGLVHCWGSNALAQCGIADGPAISAPTRTGFDQRVTALASTYGNTSCALGEDGEILCWGFRLDGQGFVGPQSGNASADPVTTRLDSDAVSHLAVGNALACATGGDAVSCWGRHYAEAFDDPEVPRVVQELAGETLTSLSLGHDSACLVIAGREVRCWGHNQSGEVGQPHHQLALVVAPSPLAEPLSGALGAVAVGYRHACVLRGAGEVWCWGSRQRGEAGPSAFTEPLERPAEVTGLPRATRISAGFRFTCIVDVRGFIWCWGDNAHAQLGLGVADPPYTSIPRWVGRAAPP